MISHQVDSLHARSPELFCECQCRNGDARITVLAAARMPDQPLVTESCEGELTVNGRRFALARQGEDGFPCLGIENEPARDGGEQIRISCGSSGLPGVRVEIVYELAGSAPVMRKWVEVIHDGAAGLRIDRLSLGRFSPQVEGDHLLLWDCDYVRDGLTRNGQRLYSPWIEFHHQYIDTFLRPTDAEISAGYPVDLDHWLMPGERFRSFTVYAFLVPNGDDEVRGLAVRNATRTLFPWTRARYLACKLAPAETLEDYIRGIDTAAEAGFEAVNLHHGWVDGDLTSPLFTNYCDYELRPDLFPNGWKDVRKLTDYAHGKGLAISFYTIYVNTWRGEDLPAVLRRNDWELIWAEDDDSSRWGVTLDPATGWGPFVNRKIEEAIVRGGFDAWHLDGPYYGDICAAPNREVASGGPNQPLAWRRQVEFYHRMLALGIHGEAAQGFQAMAQGMSRITTTGYVEGDFGELSMWEQILANRKAAYGFTRLYRPESATTALPVMPWSPDSQAPNMIPMEEHAEEYDAYLANVYGYGFEGKPFLRVAFEGPKSKAAITRWLTFWKTHELFFKEGYLIHIREPDGKQVDAVAHVLPGTPARLLLVAYNPLSSAQTDYLDLSAVTKAGLPRDGWRLAQGGRVSLSRVGFTVPSFNAIWQELVCDVDS